jgi:ketosteroid isomerase-like protein
MYHAIIRRMVRRNFHRLNAGDYEAVLAGIAPDITHTFGGSHALGGTRHSVAAMRRWFQRLYVLSPKLSFTIHAVVSSGWPWNTVIAVEWTDTAEPADGSRYVNHGVHFIRMRWGKVYGLHAYLDTQATAALCQRLAACGIAEASLSPIED